MSSEKPSIICCIRKRPVAATPEELIRQECLQHLLENGYPQKWLLVECSLDTLLKAGLCVDKRLPKRRIDILGLYGKSDGSFSPHLLVECKADLLGAEAIRQLLDYNHYLQAPYVMGYGSDGGCTGWYDPTAGKYQYLSGVFCFHTCY